MYLKRVIITRKNPQFQIQQYFNLNDKDSQWDKNLKQFKTPVSRINTMS